jgi:hypothetical protein
MSLRSRMRTVDQRLFEEVAGAQGSLLDDLLPRLSVAAN